MYSYMLLTFACLINKISYIATKLDKMFYDVIDTYIGFVRYNKSARLFSIVYKY